MTGAYYDPTAPASDDAGVGSGNITNSLAGQVSGTRATNVWYKLFQAWCFFNYGSAQTGFNAKTDPGINDTNTWPNNNWRTLPAFGQINFCFAQEQLRPETGFFDHERMPVVIMDDKHAYLCAGFPLAIGLVHSFFEVSVWIADNLDPGFTGLSGTPDMTELTRVDPADIQSLGLQTLVLADGTVRHRDANSDDALRCRGFCGLVYRNRVKPASGYDAAVDNAVIPAGKTIWQQWGPGNLPGFAGGTLVYGTDETDLKKILLPTTHGNYVTGFGGTGHGSTLDLVNNNLETAEAYLLDTLSNPTGGTILSGAGSFYDKTYVRDIYRDQSGGCMYVFIPTIVGAGDTVFWRRNGYQAGYVYGRPAEYMNGVALSMHTSAYRLTIPPAPYPVRSKWGTFVQSTPYKPETFNFAPMTAEPLMLPDSVYSHTVSWYLPSSTYSYSNLSSNDLDPAGSGIFPYAGTAYAAIAKTSADRITSWPASTSGSIIGALSGVLLYNQRRVRAGAGSLGSCVHVESMLRVSDNNGPVVSNYTSDYFPNPGTTVVDGPTEILQVCFVSWNLTLTCYCTAFDNGTAVHSDVPSSADVQIVIWDTANNVPGIVLQSGTITDGYEVEPNGFLLHGTQEIAIADLPAEWALVAICTTAPLPPSPAATFGSTSEAYVWVIQHAMGDPIFDYWFGIPRADFEDKYMRTEMAARGNVLMDEDIQGIDVPYCATYDPFPFDVPGTG